MKQNIALRTLLFCSFLFTAFACFSQSDTLTIKFKNPGSVAATKGYSQVAVVDLGNSQMLLLSGQVPLDSKGNLVGKDDIGKQTEQVFSNIQSIVSEFGGTMNNIVKLGIYLADISQLQTFREVRNKFINMQRPPASTVVQVSKLFREDVLLEVDATAIIPKK